jgi:hypothetical protein
MAVQSLETGTDYAGDGVYYLLILTLVMNYGLAGGAEYMTMLLRYLQLVVHLQLIGIPVPAIVMMSKSLSLIFYQATASVSNVNSPNILI